MADPELGVTCGMERAAKAWKKQVVLGLGFCRKSDALRGA
jgi:hypothetical protein